MALSPLCCLVAVATVLLVQPAVLTHKMSVCTVLDQLPHLQVRMGEGGLGWSGYWINNRR